MNPFIRFSFILLILSATGFLIVSAQDSPPAAATSEIITQKFRVAPTLLDALGGSPNAGGAGAADPFAAEPPDPNPEPKVDNLQAFLTTELGIEFPEGTFVKHDPKTGDLEIRHHPTVVKAIQTYLEALNEQGPLQINLRVEIYQMPARASLKVQQLCGPMDDHTPIWETVQGMMDRGQASLVTTTSSIARSGQRCKASDISEVIYPTEVDWDEKQETMLPAAFETRNVGTEIEFDPVIGADDYTIDLNFSLEHHTAPPEMRPITVTSAKTGKVVVVEMPEFHSKRIITQITMRDGMVKCVGAWRPTGKPEYAESDAMQVAFLKSELQRMKMIVPLP